jgi:hypothetical protein
LLRPIGDRNTRGGRGAPAAAAARAPAGAACAPDRPVGSTLRELPAVTRSCGRHAVIRLRRRGARGPGPSVRPRRPRRGSPISPV